MTKGERRAFTATEKQLAEQVREVRKDRKLTQQQLADAADVSLGVVSNFERFFTYPQPGNLRAILRVLDLSDADAEEQADPQEGVLERCPRCDRTFWPETYELVFDILGAYMDTLPPAERKAYQRRITAPVHGAR